MVRLTNTEEELMNLFWDVGEPLTSIDILDYAKDKTWGGNYVHRMLRELEKKQYLKFCGNVLYANRYARQFEPIISKEEYAANLLSYQGINTKTFAKVAVAFVKQEQNRDSTNKEKGGFDEALIVELEEMIEKLKHKGGE